MAEILNDPIDSMYESDYPGEARYGAFYRLEEWTDESRRFAMRYLERDRQKLERELRKRGQEPLEKPMWYLKKAGFIDDNGVAWPTVGCKQRWSAPA